MKMSKMILSDVANTQTKISNTTYLASQFTELLMCKTEC